ncbi:jg14737 [Pararge aegeria aegeria]|uniref:Jg14737 protein n=1 Tax=Pararge aegeria aegeria TaxID=348720 RepID=A0A8S4SDP7_9NEOP|nr:jg14737 [Pararge aegeria aegeria]
MEYEKEKKKHFIARKHTYRKRNIHETVNNVDMQRQPYCCKQSLRGNLCRKDLEQENGEGDRRVTQRTSKKALQIKSARNFR